VVAIALKKPRETVNFIELNIAARVFAGAAVSVGITVC